MFQLTMEEIEFVKSQFATSRTSTLFEGQSGGRRKFPYAFTEQGIYMLATVLRGEIAEKRRDSVTRKISIKTEFDAGEIHREPKEDSGAGRRAGVADLCNWSTCYINDRTKSLELQGVRTCLFYFFKIYGRKYDDR